MFKYEKKKVPLDWIKPDLAQLARHSEEKIEAMMKNMGINGQLHEGGVTEDGTLIYAHCRYLALKRLGAKEMEVKVYYGVTKSEFVAIKAAENLHHNPLTPFQKLELVRELKQTNPSWKNADLARALSVTEPWISQVLMAEKAIPPVFEAFKDGGLGTTETYEIARHPQQEQFVLWAAKQNGASRDSLRGKARRSRNGESKVKVSSAKIDLSEGAVVIRRPNLDMYLLIECLEECLKAAKKEADTYDIKTFQKMMSDRARKT
jgi:ParB-like chromosome segregation protein Spo0J